MVDSEEVQRLEAAAARQLLTLMRDGGYASLDLFWSEIGLSAFSRLTATDDSGATFPLQMPISLPTFLEDLRSAKADRHKGTWFSVLARVSAAGTFEFSYNYDSRIYWDSPSYFEPAARDATDPHPSNEAFLDDLVNYPREPEFVPPWHPAFGRTPATPDTEESIDLGALTGSELFPESLAALALYADWQRIAEALRRELVEILTEEVWSDDAVRTAYNRAFDVILQPANAATVKRIWGSANRAAGYRSKSTNIPDAEMVANPSQDLEVLLEDISDVMCDIARHQISLVD
ncbi:hypothetical protein EH165_01735 [Nakamurella antarctica]|uniref:Uncharacterized protein n=1 Tax=Nakamurella antarctica TaxID=1902245 RepID=A0A3G8ZSM4_9ACTN|nr:hypothetical protein [Nakamurella antarctica]AZI57076.1 hypothetical protein EH165_01735 [Nakamurella antarctica]